MFACSKTQAAIQPHPLQCGGLWPRATRLPCITFILFLVNPSGHSFESDACRSTRPRNSTSHGAVAPNCSRCRCPTKEPSTYKVLVTKGLTTHFRKRRLVSGPRFDKMGIATIVGTCKPYPARFPLHMGGFVLIHTRIQWASNPTTWKFHVSNE